MLFDIEEIKRLRRGERRREREKDLRKEDAAEAYDADGRRPE